MSIMPRSSAMMTTMLGWAARAPFVIPLNAIAQHVNIVNRCFVFIEEVLKWDAF
jgi:hypothetical protein